jgi:single-strand DNA-binding protein
MANLNKSMLIGRLTRDPEPILVSGIIAGAKFGFAVSNRKLDRTTQQWVDVPMFIDCVVWNRGEGNPQGQRVLDSLRKGSQIFIEGHLQFEQFTVQTEHGPVQRSKHSIVAETFQYLESRADGQARLQQTAAATSNADDILPPVPEPKPQPAVTAKPPSNQELNPPPVPTPKRGAGKTTKNPPKVGATNSTVEDPPF